MCVVCVICVLCVLVLLCFEFVAFGSLCGPPPKRGSAPLTGSMLFGPMLRLCLCESYCTVVFFYFRRFRWIALPWRQIARTDSLVEICVCASGGKGCSGNRCRRIRTYRISHGLKTRWVYVDGYRCQRFYLILVPVSFFHSTSLFPRLSARALRFDFSRHHYRRRSGKLRTVYMKPL